MTSEQENNTFLLGKEKIARFFKTLRLQLSSWRAISSIFDKERCFKVRNFGELKEETIDFLLKEIDCTFHVRAETENEVTGSLLGRGRGGIFDFVCHVGEACVLAAFPKEKSGNGTQMCSQRNNQKDSDWHGIQHELIAGDIRITDRVRHMQLRLN